MREKAETNLNGGNTKTAGLKNKTNTAGSDSFTEPTNNSSCHQHVLHFFTYSINKKKRKDPLAILQKHCFAGKNLEQTYLKGKDLGSQIKNSMKRNNLIQ